MSRIRILLACNREDISIPDNELIYPIQVGAALADNHFGGMLHDDEGINISSKNPQYCELTAQYWAWKNLDADYYGFFHHRRYLSFSDEHFPANCFADVKLKTNDQATLQKIGLNPSLMSSTIEQNDLILPNQGMFVDGETIRQQYENAPFHYADDLQCVLDIIGEKYPQMLDSANEYLDGKKGYFCNIFIMKRHIFYDYCEWLFSILQEHENRCSFDNYCPEAYRVSGYLGERLFGIYATWLKGKTDTSYKELQRTVFDSIYQPKLLEPIPNKNEVDPVTLVLSANNYYVPYMGCLLESIKEHSSQDRLYDIIVLHRDISERNQDALRRLMSAPNISLRFFNTTRVMHEYENKLFLRGHFRIETYFRLLMQDILPSYKKALYLDCDMVVNRDIAELFDEQIDGYLLAAVQDADTAGLYNGFTPEKKNYMENILKMKNPFDYFQAGTILFNLNEFRKRYTVKEIFEYAASYEWELLDQDVLNHFAEGHVKYLDMRWNVVMDWDDIRVKEIIGRAPRDIHREYMNSRKNPFIVHFAGPDKPWDNFDADFADYFWKYAQRTPFAPVILERAFRKKARAEQNELTKQRKSPLKKVKETLKPTYNAFLPKDTAWREKVDFFRSRHRRETKAR